MSFLLPAALLSSAAACLLWSTSSTPVQARADAKREGAEVFASTGCAHCHGDTGQGTAKGPALANVRKKMDAAAMTKQIKDGGKIMPPFGDALTDEQVQNLVKFLRDKHPKYQPVVVQATSK